MNRFDIIEIIGKEHFVDNLENGEFSYPKALKKVEKSIDKKLIISSDGKKHQYLDIRFVKDNVSILVETKDNFDNWNTENTYQQLQAYVNYENVLTGNKIIAILANTTDDRVKVWWGSNLTIDESHQIKNQYSLKTFEEYAEVFTNVQNDKERVLKNTYQLNEKLHNFSIGEKIRSQFVGTCLLALKNHLTFENLTAKQILGGMEEVITKLLEFDNLNKAQKLVILKTKVLESQDVRDLTKEQLQEVLRYINDNILPYINEKSTTGQDILNLFFTTFNKYVGKEDKNQAFTPDHIVHFMCQVVGINRHSKVLDPCCGSGAFLVRAMTEAMDDCATDNEREIVKKENIFGIEYEETAFGLATTNMLIHGDGNSNVRQGSCFQMRDYIENNNINIVLMNPPFNGGRKHCNDDYVKIWDNNIKQDPSKGLHYVCYIASIVKTGKLAVLLPPQCAIGNNKDLRRFKEEMLNSHTLDAVFSLPIDVFYPGSTSTACCMIFTLGQRHEKANQDTFFGYFRDDGFIKKKHLGRVERTKENNAEGIWADIESNWISLYRKRDSIAGLSVTKKVNASNEWLAEAYMETDYSELVEDDFITNIKSFIAFKIVTNQKVKGEVGGIFDRKPIFFRSLEKWRYFEFQDIFYVKKGKRLTKADMGQGKTFFIGSSEFNNGLTNKIDKNPIFEANTLTVNYDGSVGESFYQPVSYWALDSVNVLYPKFNLNPFIAMFLITIIKQEKYRFNYGRKWGKEIMEKSKIKLPVDDKGNPDWQFMEDYIKSLPYSANL